MKTVTFPTQEQAKQEIGIELSFSESIQSKIKDFQSDVELLRKRMEAFRLKLVEALYK